jgi:threonine dehydrogenase-like Zn-dependent dehydrogenase
MFCGNKRGALGLEEADGSFAEYVIADSMFTVPIPDNVSFSDTVLSSTSRLIVGSVDVCWCHNLFIY